MRTPAPQSVRTSGGERSRVSSAAAMRVAECALHMTVEVMRGLGGGLGRAAAEERALALTLSISPAACANERFFAATTCEDSAPRTWRTPLVCKYRTQERIKGMLW
jgi:hypothetical protein